jgi:membrane protease YdiL (CAAX protease family)
MVLIRRNPHVMRRLGRLSTGRGWPSAQLAHNARGMVNLRSNPRLAIPAWSALLAAALGTALMVKSSPVLAQHVSLRATIAISLLLLALPSVVAVRLHGVPMVAGLGIEAIPRRLVLLSVAAGLGLWIFSLGLIEVQYAVWAPPEGYLEIFRRLHDALRPANPLDAVWSAIAIAAAPAVFEETTVRGVLLPALRPWTGGPWAVALSALVFALMHLDPYRFAFTFVVGAALGALRLRTGSLWPSMLAHGTLNLLTFGTAPWLDDPSQPLQDPRPWLGAGLMVVGLAVSTVVFLKLGRPLTAPDAAPRLAS